MILWTLTALAQAPGGSLVYAFDQGRLRYFERMPAGDLRELALVPGDELRFERVDGEVEGVEPLLLEKFLYDPDARTLAVTAGEQAFRVDAVYLDRRPSYVPLEILNLEEPRAWLERWCTVCAGTPGFPWVPGNGGQPSTGNPIVNPLVGPTGGGQTGGGGQIAGGKRCCQVTEGVKVWSHYCQPKNWTIGCTGSPDRP